MTAFFLACAILGGGVLVAQLVLGAVGGDHDVHGAELGAHLGEHAPLHGGEPTQGLHLLSVRAIAAGLAFFGVGGLAGMATPLGLLAAIPLALAAGGAAMAAVALLMRAMLRLESDGTLRVEDAVGQTGAVYLAIPAGEPGKVHLTVRNRLVEYQAICREGALPTGASVLVVDVAGPDTVVVVPDPLAADSLTNEVSHVVR